MSLHIPDGNRINDALRQVEDHLDNIHDLLPGVPDHIAEDSIVQIQTAADSLAEAHRYLVTGVVI